MNLARFVAATSAALLVGAACGFGTVFAWSSTVEHGWPLAVAASAMSIGLEGSKGLAFAGALASFRRLQIGQGLGLLLLSAVALAYGLTAEVSLIARSRMDTVAARQHTTDTANGARAAHGAAVAELAAMVPARTVGEIDALIAPSASDKRLDGCGEHWLEGAGLRARCIELQGLRAELARALRRAELQAKIDAPLSGAPAVVADPGAKAVGTMLTAFGINVEPEHIADWMILIAVIALEAGSLFSVLLVRSTEDKSRSHPAPATSDMAAVPAVHPGALLVVAPAPAQLAHRQTNLPGEGGNGQSRLLEPSPAGLSAPGRDGQGQQIRERSVETPPLADAGLPAPVPTAEVVPLQAVQSRTRHEAARRLIAHVAARGGQVSSSFGALAEELHCPKSTLRLAADDLQASGRLTVAASKAGTRFSAIQPRGA